MSGCEGTCGMCVLMSMCEDMSVHSCACVHMCVCKGYNLGSKHTGLMESQNFIQSWVASSGSMTLSSLRRWRWGAPCGCRPLTGMRSVASARLVCGERSLSCSHAVFSKTQSCCLCWAVQAQPLQEAVRTPLPTRPPGDLLSTPVALRHELPQIVRKAPMGARHTPVLRSLVTPHCPGQGHAGVISGVCRASLGEVTWSTGGGLSGSLHLGPGEAVL